MLELRAAAETLTGRRNRNEDAFELDPGLGLFVVADGMGGYDAGDVASQMAVDVIHEVVEESDGESPQTWGRELDPNQTMGEGIVEHAVQRADREISSRSEADATRMGTTVVVIVQRGTDAVIGHVGDSRVYRYRDGELEQMTADHSFATEISNSEFGDELGDVLNTYQHFITRALGAFNQGDAVPDVQCVELQSHDRFLLCSDGVHDTLADETLERILAGEDRAEIPEELVETAFEHGSTDNITAAVVDAVPANEEGTRGD